MVHVACWTVTGAFLFFTGRALCFFGAFFRKREFSCREAGSRQQVYCLYVGKKKAFVKRGEKKRRKNVAVFCRRAGEAALDGPCVRGRMGALRNGGKTLQAGMRIMRIFPSVISAVMLFFARLPRPVLPRTYETSFSPARRGAGCVPRREGHGPSPLGKAVSAEKRGHGRCPTGHTSMKEE